MSDLAESVVQNLRAWVTAQRGFGNGAELVAAAPMAGGQSSSLLRLTCTTPDGVRASYVARCEPRGKQLFLEPDVIREYRIMSAVAAVGTVPVPEMIGAEPDEDVIGVPFFVMKEMPGEAPLGRPSLHSTGMMPRLNAEQRRTLFDASIGALAELHKIDWRRSLGFLDEEIRGGSGLDHRLTHFARWYEWTAQGRPFPITDAALRYLLNERPDASDEVLLWGDARPGNILFRPDQSISAVLDWELALVGPRELDLGYWLFMDNLHTDLIGIERLSGWPTEAETVAHYEALTGVETKGVEYFAVMGAFLIATTLIRAADLGVENGRLKATTRMGFDNTATQFMAMRLGMDVPQLCPDFARHRGLPSRTSEPARSFR